MKLFKTFIAGMILPAVISPLIILYFVIQGEMLVIEKLPFIYFGPILWGFWNILFLTTKRKVGIQDRNVKIGVYGATYGLFSALINTLYFDFTSIIPSLSDSFILWSIITYPLVLYFTWKYLVNALNMILEIY